MSSIILHNKDNDTTTTIKSLSTTNTSLTLPKTNDTLIGKEDLIPLTTYQDTYTLYVGSESGDFDNIADAYKHIRTLNVKTSVTILIRENYVLRGTNDFVGSVGCAVYITSNNKKVYWDLSSIETNWNNNGYVTFLNFYSCTDVAVHQLNIETKNQLSFIPKYSGYGLVHLRMASNISYYNSTFTANAPYCSLLVRVFEASCLFSYSLNFYQNEVNNIKDVFVYIIFIGLVRSGASNYNIRSTTNGSHIFDVTTGILQADSSTVNMARGHVGFAREGSTIIGYISNSSSLGTAALTNITNGGTTVANNSGGYVFLNRF